ncbi:MAG: BrnT family toxin [Clostridia bacterium]|nr:BrnT family toxin [Clostridia bacterium]
MYEYFDFDLESASFEWDEEKDRINFIKHGIHFKTAARVFLDPNKLIREDEEHTEELRYDILGKVGKVLFVVCAFRNENSVRLISARIATALEKARYEYGEDDFE